MKRAKSRKLKRRALRLGAVPKSPPICLDLHCAGNESDPPQDCNARIHVPMPFDIEKLRSGCNTQGWLVTITTPPGFEPMSCTVLCEKCAEAILPPELLAAAKRLQPGVA
jgi:hypothetical protein